MARELECEILSPGGSMFHGKATMVVATAVDGELGILYNHAPLVAALGEGPLRLKSADGSERKYIAKGGFLEVLKNHVTILTDKLEEA